MVCYQGLKDCQSVLEAKLSHLRVHGAQVSTLSAELKYLKLSNRNKQSRLYLLASWSTQNTCTITEVQESTIWKITTLPTNSPFYCNALANDIESDSLENGYELRMEAKPNTTGLSHIGLFFNYEDEQNYEIVYIR